MKNDLIPLIATPENLLSAWRAVRGNIPRYRRQRSAGPDNITLQEFERDLPVHLDALRRSLLKGRYQPGQAVRFSIPKNTGGERTIVILNVVDRVAQRAAQQVLEPLWEPHFLPCSYGFRPGRSLQQAVVQVSSERKAGAGWVVDGDIENCFDSLDQSLLMKRVGVLVKDGQVLSLIQGWLESGAVTAGNPKPNEQALLQWLQTAQGKFRRGWEWLLDSMARPGGPFEDRETWEWEDPLLKNQDELAEHFEDQRYKQARRQALRQLAQSSVIAAASFVRPAVGTACKTLASAVSNPVGRRMLQKTALMGGVASVAVGGSIAAYLLYRQLGPSLTGVVQGSPLSPLLANIYLHPFDEHMCSHSYNLLRFADDWVVLCQTQEQAELAYNESVRALARLKLHINRQKTQILSPAQSLDWLGVSIP